MQVFLGQRQMVRMSLLTWLHTGPVGDCAVVVVRGRLDRKTGPVLRRRLIDLVSSGQHHLALDLDGVESVDFTGLGVLVGGRRRVLSHQGSLRLVYAQQPVLKVLLQITGLAKLFAIHGSLEDVLAETHR